MTNRDDFTKATLDALARRVNLRCSNPTCRKPTGGPGTEPTRALNLGVAAHITAAAPGGPRYDPTLTSEQRASIDNGVWLCQNCAKLVDNDPDRFSTDLLRQWKRQAEQIALDELQYGIPLSVTTAPIIPTPFDLPADLPDFTGRQSEIAAVQNHLSSAGTVAISSITGMGGIGKTTLALHIAHRLAEQGLSWPKTVVRRGIY